MQIRCTQCHRPFGLNKEEVHAALDLMAIEGLGFYNIHCPHCGRTNKVNHADLLRAAPDWKPTESAEKEK